MEYIYGLLSGFAISGVIYFLYIHGKLAGVEQRIKDYVSAEIGKIKWGTHP